MSPVGGGKITETAFRRDDCSGWRSCNSLREGWCGKPFESDCDSAAAAAAEYLRLDDEYERVTMRRKLWEAWREHLRQRRDEGETEYTGEDCTEWKDDADRSVDFVLDLADTFTADSMIAWQLQYRLQWAVQVEWRSPWNLLPWSCFFSSSSCAIRA